AGLCAEIFSGNWGNFGVPGALDRVLVAAGFAAVVIAGVRLVSGRRFHARPIHVLLVVASVYALCSAVAAGTISDSKARFALLDRFGFVPFLLFVAAPVVFARERQRRFLLAALILVGAYVGLTNIFETVHLHALVFPKYIADPAIGLHFG